MFKTGNKDNKLKKLSKFLFIKIFWKRWEGHTKFMFAPSEKKIFNFGSSIINAFEIIFKKLTKGIKELSTQKIIIC